jgi:hypothetical protein
MLTIQDQDRAATRLACLLHGAGTQGRDVLGVLKKNTQVLIQRHQTCWASERLLVDDRLSATIWPDRCK